jgi:hypothetical protein
MSILDKVKDLFGGAKEKLEEVAQDVTGKADETTQAAGDKAPDTPDTAKGEGIGQDDRD